MQLSRRQMLLSGTIGTVFGQEKKVIPWYEEPALGIHKKVKTADGSKILTLDLNAFEYRDAAKVKIASLDKIDFLIANALRGVPLLYQRVAPPSLPVKGSYLYFQLDPNGDAWETVRAAKNVALYVPPDIAGVRVCVSARS